MSQEISFSQKKWMRWLWLAIILASLIFLFKSRIPQRWVDDVIYDNYDHYMSCAQLPLREDVEQVLIDHADTVEQIQGKSSNILIQTDAQTCQGEEHAGVIIYYATHAQRDQIEEILGGKTFFGVPARWINW